MLYSQNLCSLQAEFCQCVSSHGIWLLPGKSAFLPCSMCPFRSVLPLSFPPRLMLPRSQAACGMCSCLLSGQASCYLQP